ncbi:hypothetical protein X735_32245 [Mesorhizobium sp. L2C085B000]|nr:hypothetical protein X735_32245 [Mesorhizobium sp. L2C085B000]
MPNREVLQNDFKPDFFNTIVQELLLGQALGDCIAVLLGEAGTAG